MVRAHTMRFTSKCVFDILVILVSTGSAHTTRLRDNGFGIGTFVRINTFVRIKSDIGNFLSEFQNGDG